MPEPNRIDFERLADWVDGRLCEEEARAVASQVAADGETRADAEWLRAFAEASGGTILASSPPELKEELVRRFEAYARNRRGPGLPKERLVATLTFDGGLQPAMGVRSVGTRVSHRQLIYASELAEIAIDIQARPWDECFDVLGQVFPGGEETPEEFGVQLLRGATEFGITAADELGEFAFEDVPPGVYGMVLSTGPVEILISPVELSP